MRHKRHISHIVVFRKGRKYGKMKDVDVFISVEDLARRLNVSPRTIQRVVQRKELPAIRIGRQLRFKKEWIDDWLTKQTLNKEINSA